MLADDDDDLMADEIKEALHQARAARHATSAREHEMQQLVVAVGRHVDEEHKRHVDFCRG